MQPQLDTADILGRIARPIFDSPDLAWARHFLLENCTVAVDLGILCDAKRQLASKFFITTVTEARVDDLGNDQSKQVFTFSEELQVVPLVSTGDYSAALVIMRLAHSDGLVEYCIGRSILKEASSELFIVWSENLLPALPTDSSGLPNVSQMLQRAALVPPEEAGDAPILRRTLKFQYFGPSWDAAASVAEKFTVPRSVADVHLVCDSELFISGKYDESILLSYWIPLQNRLACFSCNTSESPCTCSPAITKPCSSDDWDAQARNFTAFTGRYRGVSCVEMGIPGKMPRKVIDRKVCYTHILPVGNDDFRLEELRKTMMALRMSNPSPWQAARVAPLAIDSGDGHPSTSNVLAPPADDKRLSLNIAPRPNADLSKPAVAAEIDGKRAKMISDRKERNRLSAARSNARRRAKMKEVKDDLKKAEEAENTLREEHNF